MFQGFPCDCVHDGHVPVVDELSGELSLGYFPGDYVKLLSELLGVDLRTCSSSNWLVGPSDGCRWRCLTCFRVVGDGFVFINVCDVWCLYDVHPWILVRGVLHDLHPWSLCGGRWQLRW